MKRLCRTLYLTDEEIDLIIESLHKSYENVKSKKKRDKAGGIVVYLGMAKVYSKLKKFD